MTSEEHYERLYEIYNGPLTKDARNDFDEIIDKTLTVINPRVYVRLIGDELSDRGQNDYFVLKILTVLQAKGVQIEVLWSNHGANFLLTYHAVMQNNNHLKSIGMDESIARSLSNLNQAIQEEIIQFNEIDNMVRNSYLPNVKLISASLDCPNNSITIYSHAPIGMVQIKWAAEYFDIPYKDSTIIELASIIDKINDQFLLLIQQNNFQNAYTFESSARVGTNQAIMIDALMFIAENRFQSQLQQPLTHNGYNLYFTHGHDLQKSKQPNVTNLDNYLGKMDLITLGDLEVAHSDELRLLDLNKSWLGENMLEEGDDNISTEDITPIHPVSQDSSPVHVRPSSADTPRKSMSFGLRFFSPKRAVPPPSTQPTLRKTS